MAVTKSEIWPQFSTHYAVAVLRLITKQVAYMRPTFFWSVSDANSVLSKQIQCSSIHLTSRSISLQNLNK